MREIKFKDEVLYLETLDNNLKVFMYPTNKTKNFYITVSTYFGAEVSSYKKDDKVYNAPFGSAHFLEHRVMDFSKNKKAAEEINKLGSIVNAYTTYNGTNYNLFGSSNILENIKILFDRVFYANIKEEDVENEKGIILEEYYMALANPFYQLEVKSLSNAFHNAFIKVPVIGTEDSIKSMNYKDLNRLYKDFYTPNNMFVIVLGNFNKEEVLEYIKDYTKNFKDKKPIKVIKPKEIDKVNIIKEEIILPVNEEKISVVYKVKKPKGISSLKLLIILNFVLSETFGKTSKFNKELLLNNIERYNYGIEEVDKYFAIYFNASTSKYTLFKELVNKYINTLHMTKEGLIRKQRVYIRSYILSFDDIIELEDCIASDLFTYKKVCNNIDSLISKMTVKEISNILKFLDFNSYNEVIMHK